MKTKAAMRLPLLGCIGVVVLGGCKPAVGPNVVKDNPNRKVTISVSADSAQACEVDYPVAVLRKSRNHTIEWGSADNNYIVIFDKNNGPPTNPIGQDKVAVPAGGSSGPFPVTVSTPMYFKYAIYFADRQLNATTVCKTADDDHDTGLNVKR